MSKRAILATILVVIPTMVMADTTMTPAENDAWDIVHQCFDRELAGLLPANEPAETLFRAVRTVCDPQVNNAEREMAKGMMSDHPEIPTGPVAMAMIGKRVDDGLFAYTVRFKARGGPVPW